MSRARWLAALLAGAGGAAAWWLWPAGAARAALDCPPAAVHLDEAGVARCGPGRPLPAAQAISLGLKLDLNQASQGDLEAIPGLGAPAAKALVHARLEHGAYTSWAEVDAVAGIGPARLAVLQKHVEFHVPDGGAW